MTLSGPLRRIGRRPFLGLIVLGLLALPGLLALTQIRLSDAFGPLLPHSHRFAPVFERFTLEPPGMDRVRITVTLGNQARIVPELAASMAEAIAGAEGLSGTRMVRRGPSFALVEGFVAEGTRDARWLELLVRTRLSAVEAPGPIQLRILRSGHRPVGLSGGGPAAALFGLVAVVQAGGLALVLSRSRALMAAGLCVGVTTAASLFGYGVMAGLAPHRLALPAYALAGLFILLLAVDLTAGICRALARGTLPHSLPAALAEAEGRPVLVAVAGLSTTFLLLALPGHGFLSALGLFGALALLLAAPILLVGLPLLAGRRQTVSDEVVEALIVRANRAERGAVSLGRSLSGLAALTVASSFGMAAVAGAVVLGWIGASAELDEAAPAGGVLARHYVEQLVAQPGTEGGAAQARLMPGPPPLTIYVREDAGGCPEPSSDRAARQIESYAKSLDYVRQVRVELPLADGPCRYLPVEIVPAEASGALADRLIAELRQLRADAGEDGAAILFAGGGLGIGLAAREALQAPRALLLPTDIFTLLSVWVCGGLLIALAYRRVAPVLAWTALTLTLAAAFHGALTLLAIPQDALTLSGLVLGGGLSFFLSIRIMDPIERSRRLGFRVRESIERALEARAGLTIGLSLLALLPMAAFLLSPVPEHRIFATAYLAAGGIGALCVLMLLPIVLAVSDHELAPEGHPDPAELAEAERRAVRELR
ncbi:MAG: hypothetical protein HXY25_10335 [Alphaproteobacteria bacterium]|nr:hypothetical protein [Alphaproteobacteria bacterium]